MNDDTPEAGNAIRPLWDINKVVEAKNSSEFITHVSVCPRKLRFMCTARTNNTCFKHIICTESMSGRN